jgi:hypothetical protein
MRKPSATFARGDCEKSAEWGVAGATNGTLQGFLFFDRPGRRGAAIGHQFVVSGYFVVHLWLDLRSMKPFAQRLGITSGRQF